MIGDSTMAAHAVLPASPTRGWGQMFQPYFKESLRVENHAMSGRSSRSFIAEGRWKIVIEQIKPGDFLIIQFGHNDEKTDEKRHTDPFAEFTQNLARFADEARKKGATPVLATPVSRSVWEKDETFRETHGDYPKAVRELAERQKIPLLDLNALTEALIRKLGPVRAKSLFANADPGDYESLPKGWSDGSHFNAYGACRVCDYAAMEIKKNVPELARHLREGGTDPMRK